MSFTKKRVSRRTARNEGYILVPVIVMLSLVLAAVFTTTLQGSVGIESTVRAREAREAILVARSGIQHAIHAAGESSCSNYALPATPFGAHSYSATYSPTSSSPVSITSTATLASGLTYSVTRASAAIYEKGGAKLFLQPGAEGKDTKIKESQSSVNAGSDALLEADLPGVTHALLEFDLSGLPPTAVVRSAKLELHGLNGFSGTVEVRRVTRSWLEGTGDGTGSGSADGAIWDKYDGDNVWTTAGGDFDPKVAASAPFATYGTWVEFDVSALVSAWHGGVPNHGVLLTTTNKWIEFASSDHADATLHPKLTIDYDCECDPNPVTQVAVIQPGPGFGKDALIYAGAAADNNYGSHFDLFLGGLQNYQSLVQFDLSNLPSNAIVTDARLEMYADAFTLAPAGGVSVHRITSDWAEGSGGSLGLNPPDGVTWNSTDGLSPWLSPGGDFDPAPIDNISIMSPLPAWYEWDVSSAVSDWKQGVQPNYGFMLLESWGSLNKAEIVSSDDATSGLRPKLTVTFYCPCGAVCSQAGAVGGDLLMVVVDPNNLTNEEMAKFALMEAWGFTISLIDEADTIAEYEAAFSANDVVFISEDVDSSKVDTKVSASPIGVVAEEPELSHELGLAQSIGWTAGNRLEITNNSHYITTPFALDFLTILDTNQALAFVSGGLSADLSELATVTGGGWDPALVVLDQGSERWDELAGIDARRVQLPWGGNGFSVSDLSDDGRLIFERALEWAATKPSAPGGYLDRFAYPTCDPAIDAIGSHGSLGWSGSPWSESEGDDFCGGDIQVEQHDFSYRMGIEGNAVATRPVNLSGFAFATLRFRYKSVGTFDATQFMAIESSDNGGATWTEIGRVDSPNAVSDATLSLPITTAMTADSMIRFRAENLGGERFSLDDVAVLEELTLPPFVCSVHYRDQVMDEVYTGDDGSQSWTTDWLEVNESDGPTNGDERAIAHDGGFVLRVGDNDGGGEGLQREADLSMQMTATLNFLYKRISFDSAVDYVTIAASNDGGANWTDLGTITGVGTDATFLEASYPLDAFLMPNARIRFLTSPDLGKNDMLYIDDVEICLEMNPGAAP